LNEERKDGYRRVATPHITKEALYFRSRHLPYYADTMYSPLDIDGENYYLRPMNCPHHHLIYSATRHSYRELPMRIAEYGQDYRYEASGGLTGLMRVRGFCMNDAHIYCRYDQAKDEFIRVDEGCMPAYYDLMNIKEYYMRLSVARPGQIGQVCRRAGEMAEGAGHHPRGDEGVRLSLLSRPRAKPPFTAPRSTL